MKRLILIAAFLSVFTGLYAQQEPQYSQFMYNKLPVNAAYTGARDVLSIRTLYRNQWVKLPGSPQTMTFSIHSPLRNENLAVGLNVVHDRLGVTQQTWVNGTYAYRMKISDKDNMRLALGINAGIMYYTAALTELEVNDQNDMALAENIKRVMPDVGAGIYIDGDHFYAGVSIPNFIGTELYNRGQSMVDIENDEMDVAKRFRHLMVMAGGIIPVGDIFKIRPQFMIKHVVGSGAYSSPLSADFNLSFMFMDRVAVGGSFQTTFKNKPLENYDSFQIMSQFWPTQQFMIGYSYDFTLSELSNYSNGTHEIVLGFDFNFKKKNVITPRYF